MEGKYATTIEVSQLSSYIYNIDKFEPDTFTAKLLDLCE